VRATVLIVDDHEDYRRSASALLEAEGFAVVGEAADGAAAIEAVERLRPEVVLLDIQLPDVDGLSVAERLAARRDPSDVVLISSREAAAYDAPAERIGHASGPAIHPKESPPPRALSLHDADDAGARPGCDSHRGPQTGRAAHATAGRPARLCSR
jgi:CheY-like chemotaxis protein